MIEYNHKPDYEIVQHITDGGSSHIYLVKYEDGHGILKLARDDSYTTKLQFENEAELLKGMNHESIPKLLSFHKINGKPAILMTLMPGLNLKYAIEQKNLQFNWKETVNIIHQLINITKYMHDQEPSIVIRDIKPSNIIYNDNHKISLVDFGTSSNHTNEIHNKAFGTKGYAPPEQYKNGCVEKRSDLFAIGATMFYIHTGNTLEQYSKRRILKPNTPKKFWRFIEKATEIDLNKRFQSINEMSRELNQIRPSFFEKIKSLVKQNK